MPRTLLATVLILLIALVLPVDSRRAVGAAESPSVAGKLLVAAPSMTDPRFAGTVILMVKHTGKGALGFVVNRVNGHRPIAEILTALGRNADGVKDSIDIHWGGPVERDVAVVVHTPDYKGTDTRAAPGGFALTGDPDVLRAIGLGKGPKRYIFMRGYAGWSAGQLERELKRKAWVVVPVDPALVFARNHAQTWKRAYAKRGLDL
jgi:putative transcriptional regulator